MHAWNIVYLSSSCYRPQIFDGAILSVVQLIIININITDMHNSERIRSLKERKPVSQPVGGFRSMYLLAF